MENFSVPADFDRVWARVTERTEENAPVPLCRELENFMQGEARSVAFYQSMVSRCNKNERRMLIGILADERRHLKNLQMEYFMETGDTYAAAEQPYFGGEGMLSALRSGVMTEAGAAESYRNAAKSRYGDLADMYSAMAEDEARHSKMLREALGRCFKEQG